MRVKIKKDVEVAVREAFAGAVGGEPERLEAAITTIADRGDAYTRESISLALAVDYVALHLLHDGQRPTAEELEDTAGTVAEDASEWSIDTTEEQVLEFLEALVDERESSLTPADFAVLLSVSAAGCWLPRRQRTKTGRTCWTRSSYRSKQ